MMSLVPERFDLIVPCYNPPEGWAQTLICQYQATQEEMASKAVIHCVLVNDGSRQGVTTDDISLLTAEIPHFKYIQYPQNRGKGYAIRQGAKSAKSRIVGFTDIDFPYEASCVSSMYTLIESGCDLVVGHRSQKYYDRIPLARRMLSRVLRFTMKILMRLPVQDTQSGLKLFSQDANQLLLKTSVDRYLFDMEFIKLAARQKLQVCTTPLQLRDGVEMEQMSLSIISTEMKNFIKIWLS